MNKIIIDWASILKSGYTNLLTFLLGLLSFWLVSYIKHKGKLRAELEDLKEVTRRVHEVKSELDLLNQNKFSVEELRRDKLVDLMVSFSKWFSSLSNLSIMIFDEDRAFEYRLEISKNESEFMKNSLIIQNLVADDNFSKNVSDLYVAMAKWHTNKMQIQGNIIRKAKNLNFTPVDPHFILDDDLPGEILIMEKSAKKILKTNVDIILPLKKEMDNYLKDYFKNLSNNSKPKKEV